MKTYLVRLRKIEFSNILEFIQQTSISGVKLDNCVVDKPNGFTRFKETNHHSITKPFVLKACPASREGHSGTF